MDQEPECETACIRALPRDRATLSMLAQTASRTFQSLTLIHNNSRTFNLVTFVTFQKKMLLFQKKGHQLPGAALS